jgi:Uma2 family endonuclease
MSANPSTIVLETGDRLSREEFHRRYCLRPDIRMAQLVKGVVYVPLPERYGVHDEPAMYFRTLFGVYASRTDGVKAGSTATLFLGDNSEVQADAFLFRVPPPGPNAARVRADSYIEGAPQLVVEVAASTVAYDLGTKRDLYRLAGVLEYVVWRTLDRQIDWFRLQNGGYVLVVPDERGVIQSEAFPGLRLNVAKMLAGDLTGVLAELDA